MVAVSGFARAQTPAPDAPLPSAPAAKPSFVLPPATYEVPKGPTPGAKKDLICYAPPEGLFTRENQGIPVELRGQMHSYSELLASQIFHEWESHLTVGEKNAWKNGKKVAARFAIMPDGSYTKPEITVSSGKEKDDVHALDAIYAHASFPPPPGDLKKPMPFCMVFGYNLTRTEMVPDWDDSWQQPAPKKQP